MILFEHNGIIGAGEYLPGHYAWSQDMRLTVARLRCDAPPESGVLTMALEVGGVLTGEIFNITAGGKVAVSMPLSRVVPANATVRWLVTGFTGPMADAAMEIGITLEAGPAGFSQFFIHGALMTVNWAEGRLCTPIFNYNPATRIFTERFPGSSQGRARVQKNGDTAISFFIGSVEALRVAPSARVTGVLSVPNLIAIGPVATKTSPRLEFMVNGFRIATLTQSQLLVPAAVSATPVAAAGQFQFYSGGNLTAALSLTGVVATAFKAPI